ncbi:Putative Heat shock 70 kDa protein [Rhizopus microsporus]|nr:Putative Heat shock 70 kDa protein [Rhizopus microsporus]
MKSSDASGRDMHILKKTCSICCLLCSALSEFNSSTDISSNVLLSLLLTLLLPLLLLLFDALSCSIFFCLFACSIILLYVEDKAIRERTESKNKLENYIYTIKSQLSDDGVLAKKISAEDKEAIEDAIKDKLAWIDENPTALREDYDEKREELESVVNPITTKLYADGSADSSSDYEEPLRDHDEL